MNRAILPGLIVVLLLSLQVGAAELPVPSPNYPTIQAAIDDANDGDVVIVAAGEYLENIDFKGKAITVRSSEPDDWDVVKRTIIDGSEGVPRENGSCVLFNKGEGRTSILDGITLTRGTGGGAEYYYDRSLGRSPVHVGGGILCQHSSPTIRRCIIRDNGLEDRAPYGGGIALLDDCQAMISNCLIVGNRGATRLSVGCGIVICGDPELATSTIMNCTIAYNTPDEWQDWAYQVDCRGTRPRISNTIIWNKLCEGLHCDDRHPLRHYTRSILMKDPSVVTYSCVRNAYKYTEDYWDAEPCDLTSFGGNISVEPHLTLDGHLEAGSPCIDAGDPSGNFAGLEDVDGEPRLMGARVDIGIDEFLDTDSDDLPDWWETKHFASATAAGPDDDPDGDGYNNLAEYEVSTNPTVAGITYYVDAENGDDSYDGRAPEWDGEHGPKRTIQAAIDIAVNTDTVIAAQGRYVENIDYKGKAITVRSSEPGDWDVVENTTIDGSEGEPRENGSCVVFNKGEGRTSILEGLTLTRGTGGGAEYYYDRSLGKSPVLAGGGILCQHSSPTIRRCIIRDNGLEDRAPYGGGIALLNDCKAMISNCIIVRNTGATRMSVGCGIIICGSPELARSTIMNCTIAHNMPDRWQDWAYQVDCRGTRPRISNTIIWNKACEGDPECYDWAPPERYYTRSILIKDPLLVTYSCVKNAYTYTDDYWYAEPCDLTSFGGNIDESPGFLGPYIKDYPNEADYHLVSQSPCINAGNPNFAGEAGGMDIDGDARVMAGRIDIGADEVVPRIVVTAPAEGDVWTSGSTHQVEWSSYGAGAVNILYSKDGGSDWQTIETGAADTGSYTWDVANRIRSELSVVSVLPAAPDPNVVCVDSGIFTIQPYRAPRSVPRRRRQGQEPPIKYGPEYGCVKWIFETDGPVTSSVTLGRKSGQKVNAYIACEDGKLYTLDADTGALLWSYDTNSPLLGSAAEGPHGTVYFAATDGKLYALNKTGGLLWTHTTKRPVFSSPVVSADGRIYICSQDGTLYALARDGSELWRFETNGSGMVEGSIFATPAVDADGTVYIGGLYDPNLYALNRDDGAIKWVCNFEHTIQVPDEEGGEPQEVNVAGWPFASPVVAFDGTVYQGLLFDSEIYAIEPTAGGISWSTSLVGLRLRYGKAPDDVVLWYDAAEPPEYVEVDGQLRLVRSVTPIRHAYCWSTPALGPDGAIYVSFNDPYLRAVDPNGTIKWMTGLGSMGGFTLSVGDDGLIYAASDDHYLYVVDPDGSEIARFEGDGWLSHPVIAEDHTIIVSDANNTVWAISQETCDGQEPVLDGANEPEPVVTKRPVKIKKQPKEKNMTNVRARRL